MNVPFFRLAHAHRSAQGLGASQREKGLSDVSSGIAEPPFGRAGCAWNQSVSTRWHHGSARAMPCKGWPSATAFGGFGLDKALPVRRFAAIGSTPSRVDHESQFHMNRRGTHLLKA